MLARQRERYPDDWEAMSLACKARAKWRCEQCGIAEGTWRIGHFKAYKEWLQAAHLDHDPENLNPRLMALCQACHLRHDASENGKRAHRARYQNKYEAEVQAGQLELYWFDEMEAMEA